jgi:hypothetical protein
MKDIEGQIREIIRKLALIPERERPQFIKDHMKKYRNILGDSEKDVEMELHKLFLLIDANRRDNSH